MTVEQHAHNAYVEMLVKACRTNTISAGKIAKRHRAHMEEIYVSFVRNYVFLNEQRIRREQSEFKVTI